MTEKQICSLDKIHKFYVDYYNKLEILWYDAESGNLNENKIKDKFFELKDSETSIDNTINDTIRDRPERGVNQAKEHSDQYFQRVFKTSNNE